MVQASAGDFAEWTRELHPERLEQVGGAGDSTVIWERSIGSRCDPVLAEVGRMRELRPTRVVPRKATCPPSLMGRRAICIGAKAEHSHGRRTRAFFLSYPAIPAEP
jgi:hypothetical protein